MGLYLLHEMAHFHIEYMFHSILILYTSCSIVGSFSPILRGRDEQRTYVPFTI
jgi:hypothetical protein